MVDAAAIFVSLAPDEELDFPDALRLELEAAGQSLASAAVRARVSIVTEVIGASPAALTELIDALRSVGYLVDVEYVNADVTQAWQWNAARSENNISAYYAEEFNIRWLVRAARAERHARGKDISSERAQLPNNTLHPSVPDVGSSRSNQLMYLHRVIKQTTLAKVQDLDLRSQSIADRWACISPAKVKELEAKNWLLPRLKKQANLEAATISDARVAGKNNDVPDSDLLELAGVDADLHLYP